MNTHHSHTGHDVGDQDDKGFTLIEILIAIVLVGILSAVAVVGISNLVSKGTGSACTATSDSAKAAATVYFASNNAFPATLNAMVTGGQLTLPTGVTAPANVTVGAPWTMTMTPGLLGAAPSFACTTP
jgi:prepilin-type N-terminal cleavage/methylation domain-containing protein